jgi:2-dehydropantoate 2-reductase
MHSGTVVLPAINGLPWWYFMPEGVPQQGLRLRCVDPQGDIERAVAFDHVVGLSVFASSKSPAPGVVHHTSGQRLVFGEPAGGSSARVDELVARFARAGFGAEASKNIRGDIWNKLLGNASFNPVSLLTQEYSDEMIDDPGLNRLFVRMMTEAIAVGEAIGLPASTQPVDRVAFARGLGHIKTSMLQDLEAGRSVEVEAILGALVECAEAAKTPAPILESVLALARGRARTIGSTAA